MEINDKVLFWQSGKQRGIYGSGILEGKPYEKGGEWRVRVKYTNHFDPPILKDSLLKHPVLRKLRILKPPFQETVFRATKEQWKSIQKFKIIREPDNFAIQSQYPEGGLRRRLANVYERNPEARRECLQHYGYDCCVCKFNFEATYGTHGAGFIHVHHLKQVAKRKKQYKVNPISDLQPICPNCHAMIHKDSKMLRIEDLKRLIQKQNRK